MDKINVAELLKDCPRGMELDCTMYDDVYFDYVDELNIIHCYIQHETHKTSITFNQHGTYNSDIKSKCVIFPKDKTTWKGFQIPFKDGDIVTCKDRGSLIAFIYKKRKNVAVVKYHFALHTGGVGTFTDGEIALVESELVFATEEEKTKLFDAIKANGYKWNAETKTLEKLIEPKFKVGDQVITTYGKIGVVSRTIWSERDNCVRYELEADVDSFYFDNELQLYKEQESIEEQKLIPPYMDYDVRTSKEETIEGNELLNQLIDYFNNTPRDVIEKEWHEYDKYNEIGPAVDKYLKYVNTIRQPQYPKTYEECCEILSIPTYYKLRYYTYEHGYNEYTTLNKLCSLQDKLNILGKLLICLEAYWKIAGEQMGLDKPWEPDWDDENEFKYGLYHFRNGIMRDGSCINSTLLAFPTEEMRDAFYENFKELINKTKELL